MSTGSGKKDFALNCFPISSDKVLCNSSVEQGSLEQNVYTIDDNTIKNDKISDINGYYNDGAIVWNSGPYSTWERPGWFPL